MAADVGIRLFGRNHQKVFVGDALASLEVDLLLLEAERPGIAGMGVVVEVAEVEDVDAKSAEDRDPGRLVIQVLRSRSSSLKSMWKWPVMTL